MDDSHLLQAARYIELNPVRAGFVERPEDYPWSSAAANMLNRTDRLIARPLLPRMVGDWSKFIKGNQETGSNANLSEIIRKHERTGRPLGGDGFIRGLEKETGRVLRKGKPGPQRGRQRERGQERGQRRLGQES